MPGLFSNLSNRWKTRWKESNEKYRGIFRPDQRDSIPGNNQQQAQENPNFFQNKVPAGEAAGSGGDAHPKSNFSSATAQQMRFHFRPILFGSLVESIVNFFQRRRAKPLPLWTLVAAMCSPFVLKVYMDRISTDILDRDVLMRHVANQIFDPEAERRSKHGPDERFLAMMPQVPSILPESAFHIPFSSPQTVGGKGMISEAPLDSSTLHMLSFLKSALRTHIGKNYHVEACWGTVWRNPNRPMLEGRARMSMMLCGSQGCTVGQIQATLSHFIWFFSSVQFSKTCGPAGEDPPSFLSPLSDSLENALRNEGDGEEKEEAKSTQRNENKALPMAMPKKEFARKYQVTSFGSIKPILSQEQISKIQQERMEEQKQQKKQMFERKLERQGKNRDGQPNQTKEGERNRKQMMEGGDEENGESLEAVEQRLREEKIALDKKRHQFNPSSIFFSFPPQKQYPSQESLEAMPEEQKGEWSKVMRVDSDFYRANQSMLFQKASPKTKLVL